MKKINTDVVILFSPPERKLSFDLVKSFSLCMLILPKRIFLLMWRGVQHAAKHTKQFFSPLWLLADEFNSKLPIKQPTELFLGLAELGTFCHTDKKFSVNRKMFKMRSSVHFIGRRDEVRDNETSSEKVQEMYIKAVENELIMKLVVPFVRIFELRRQKPRQETEKVLNLETKSESLLFVCQSYQ